jgi:hypothetical protein
LTEVAVVVVVVVVVVLVVVVTVVVVVVVVLMAVLQMHCHNPPLSRRSRSQSLSLELFTRYVGNRSQIPPFTSTSEFLLDLVNADFSDAAVVKDILDQWPQSDQAKQNDERLTAICDTTGRRPSAVAEFVPDNHYSTSFLNQFVVRFFFHFHFSFCLLNCLLIYIIFSRDCKSRLLI